MITKITIFLLIFTFIVPAIFLENSFSQTPESISPRQQWNHLPDPDSLTCKDGLILIQKNDGSPACTTPSTYMKLVDRGYGKFDSSQLMKRSEMMMSLMYEIIKDERLTTHWHIMMKDDPKILHQTMSNIVTNLKENPPLLDNVIEPMISNSEMKEKMIVQMKKNDQMMMSLQNDSKWMNSVHEPHLDLDLQTDPEINKRNECSSCEEINENTKKLDFYQPKVMEDMIHHIWINENLRNRMQFLMLESPVHMESMNDQLMEPILEYVMSDPDLRQQMIQIMMENHQFMNSIRH